VLAALALAVAATGAQAQGRAAATKAPAAPQMSEELREVVERHPVTVTTRDGKRHVAEIIVTHFRPAGDGPFPLAVLSHGRGPLAERAKMGRYRFVAWVKYWVCRGFAVAVPTRVGYGETGQALDPESSGRCQTADYRPVVTAMVDQIAATVAAAAAKPWVDATRVVLAGQSYGGFATVVAAGRVPGVVGAVNFVGGLGGRPDVKPGEPCDGRQVADLATLAGQRNRVPMLWLYAENDRYWGDAWPRKWAEAYRAAGGQVNLHIVGPVADDGHALRWRGFSVWRPLVDSYLAAVGFPVPRSEGAPPATAFAPVEAVDAVPVVQAKGRDGYRSFLEADVPRAFAIGGQGAWAWRSGPNAASEALALCGEHAKTACRLYAVDDAVVWPDAREN
jgi:dienelactone hydrolase